VADRDALGQQVVGHEPAMATPPHRLGAHDRAAMLIGQRAQLREPGTKRLGHRVIGVIAEGVVAPERVRRLGRAFRVMPQPAERPDVTITDAGRCERLRQRVGVELRVGARARHRTHIDEQIDPRLSQQVDKLGGRSRRMADREDGHLSLRAQRSNLVPIALRPNRDCFVG